MVKKEEIVVTDTEDKEYKIEVGEISYGQRCNILKKSMKVKVDNIGTIKGTEFDYVEYERLTTIHAIKRIEPEVKDKIGFVDGLPSSEAKKIVNVALKINPF